MEIKTVEIENLSGGGFVFDWEGVRHLKALSSLSVVQAVHGTYEIGLDGGPLQRTEEGGAFFAPSGVMQEIVHHNGRRGVMEAQWVFMNIRINGMFDFEDLFECPTLIPLEYSEELTRLIGTVRNDGSVCRRYAAAYEIAHILMELAKPKEVVLDRQAILLKRYVEEHYTERITKEDLAACAHCSVAGVYRLFRKHFGMAPSQYINKARIGKASVLLESGVGAVGEIASAVGFDDPVYFSKLFKAYCGISPRGYRKSFEALRGNAENDVRNELKKNFSE